MAKQKKNSDEIVVSIGSQVPSPDQVDIYNTVSSYSQPSLAGNLISINLKANSYFGVGPIWLTPENYWCEVPHGLSSDEYLTIQKSINVGTIVLGKQFIAPVDKPSNILEKYWMMIERQGMDNKKTKAEFSMLIRRGTDSGWTALEIVNYCLERENKGKRRKDVIRLLEQVAKNYDGPLRLYEPPDEAEGIKKVTITADGLVKITTNAGEEIAKPLGEPAAPSDHVRGNKTSEQAVNDIFA